MKEVCAIVMVFVGCCSTGVFLELLIQEIPSSGNLITFTQFFTIAFEGFIFTAHFGTKKPRIGIKNYLIVVALFSFANICNNYVFIFNIPMPLHMIIRAGSLITNMIMGILILNRKYSLSKYMSVVMITLGIVICTIQSGKNIKPAVLNNQESNIEVFFWWTVGVFILVIALLVSARLGIYQEVLYKRYGKYPREALFYTHLLPLPGFIILYKDIYDSALLYAQSRSVTIPLLNIGLPKLYLYLAGNVLTQCICINSVYVLTTECTSLTVTLVVTLRKFASLLFSIIYFQNEFTLVHWLGTLLVFVGTLTFTELLQKACATCYGHLSKQPDGVSKVDKNK